MAQFAASIQYVLDNEGSGYTDNPSDSGGPTKWGVTLSVLSKWRKALCSSVDVQNLTEAEAQQIYQGLYWTPLGLDDVVDQNVATAILDQGVNRGVFGVGITTQKALQALGANVQLDGTIGPMTRVALNSANPHSFLAEFIPLVQNTYVNRVVTDPTQITFLEGWLSRSQKLIKLIV